MARARKTSKSSGRRKAAGAKPTAQRPVIIIRGRYDAAQTNDDNSRHWAAADSLNADQANSYEIRKRTRERARYEVANNCYARGIVDTYAYDVVGSGPRLQLHSPDEQLNTEVELAWAQWCLRTRFARKLRTMHIARATDGEAFALLTNNLNLPTRIKLDVLLRECDRVHDPAFTLDANNVDGVKLDAYGNPAEYAFLRDHPGGFNYPGTWEVDWIPAKFVLHWFRADRPEQHRGVSELLPALELFAPLRRYTRATVTGQETAADITAVVQTDASPTGDEEAPTTWEAVDIDKGVMAVMPYGWQMKQFEGGKPTTDHPAFVTSVLCEMGRAVCMTRNVVSGDSSAHTYSGGRMDKQTYYKAVNLISGDMGIEICDQVLEHWMFEGNMAYGWGLPLDVNHEWYWDQPEPFDENKAATAATERLSNGTSSLPREFAMAGLDWRTEMTKAAESLNVPLETLQAALFSRLFSPAGQAAIAASGKTDRLIEEIQNALSK